MVIALLAALAAQAPPEFVVDEAKIVTEEGRRAITAECERLRRENGVDLYVATIASFASRKIERGGGAAYTRDMLRAWAPDGIVVLLSVEDRFIHAEVGPPLAFFDPASVLQEHARSKLAQREYSAALVEGARALAAAARKKPLPPIAAADGRWSGPVWLMVIGGGLFAVGTILSLVRAGTGGWGWAFWAVIGMVLLFLLEVLLTPRRRSYGWGGGGGSIWRGTSGRTWRSGGATGSWCLAFILAGAALASAQDAPMEWSRQREFIHDGAKLLTPADCDELQQVEMRLRRYYGVMLKVVTAPKLPERVDAPQDGIVLALSEEDRRACIAPGHRWATPLGGIIAEAEPDFRARAREGQWGRGLIEAAVTLERGAGRVYFPAGRQASERDDRQRVACAAVGVFFALLGGGIAAIALVRWRRRIPAAVMACVLLGAATAEAQSYPPCPPEGECVSDVSGLISPSDRAQIKSTADALRAQHGVPLVVVAIPSIASCGVHATIERFATQLFDYYGRTRSDWSKGILLVLAKDDRKARIEAGSWWGTRLNGAAYSVMQGTLVPHFKRGNYSGGMAAGAAAIAAQAPGAMRAAEVPPSHAPSHPYVPFRSTRHDYDNTYNTGFGGFAGFGCLFVVVVIFIIFAVVMAVIRVVARAASPWSGGMWGGGYGGYSPGGCSSGGYGRRHWGGSGWSSGRSFGFGRSSFGGSSFGSGGRSGGGSGRGATGSW